MMTHFDYSFLVCLNRYFTIIDSQFKEEQRDTVHINNNNNKNIIIIIIIITKCILSFRSDTIRFLVLVYITETGFIIV
jgi:hypothetical protein